MEEPTDETVEPTSSLDWYAGQMKFLAACCNHEIVELHAATPGERIFGITTPDGIGLSVTIAYTP